jgi:hypothetical protein
MLVTCHPFAQYELGGSADAAAGAASIAAAAMPASLSDRMRALLSPGAPARRAFIGPAEGRALVRQFPATARLNRCDAFDRPRYTS